MTARTELKDHIQPLLSQTFGERCCSLPRKGGGDGGGWQIWEGPKASVRDNWLFLFHWQDFISKNPNPFLRSGAAVPLSLNRSTPGSEGSLGQRTDISGSSAKGNFWKGCFNPICEAKPAEQDPEPSFCWGLVGEGPGKAPELTHVPPAGHTLPVVYEREGLNLHIPRFMMGWAPPGTEHLGVQQCWVPQKASQVPEVKKLKAIITPLNCWLDKLRFLSWVFSWSPRVNLWEQRATLAGDAVLIEPIAASPSCFVLEHEGCSRWGQIGLGLSELCLCCFTSPSTEKCAASLVREKQPGNISQFLMVHLWGAGKSYEFSWYCRTDGKSGLYPNLSKWSCHSNIFSRMGQTWRCIIDPQAGAGCEGPCKPPVTLTLPAGATGSLPHPQKTLWWSFLTEFAHTKTFQTSLFLKDEKTYFPSRKLNTTKAKNSSRRNFALIFWKVS